MVSAVLLVMVVMLFLTWTLSMSAVVWKWCQPYWPFGCYPSLIHVSRHVEMVSAVLAVGRYLILVWSLSMLAVVSKWCQPCSPFGHYSFVGRLISH